MTPGTGWIDPATVDALGLALVHFLWQGACIAAALFVALRLARRAGPAARYGLACAALAAMLAAPVVTALSLSRSAAFDDVDGATAAGSVARPTAPGAVANGAEPAPPSAAAAPADAGRGVPALPALVLTWCVGVAAFAARFAGGAIRARRLTRVAAEPAEAALQLALSRLARRMGVRRPVRLIVSGLVTSPATLGWAKPVVLVPAGVFVGLTPAQLEAVFAHELAHVRRHDFLVNLLQVAAETLLFYHPAVWWVSRVIARERELACDDLAVGACGDALVYARALTRLERLCADHPRLALAAGGGELYERVLRLVEPADDPRGARREGATPRAAVAAAAMLALATGLALETPRRGGDPAAAALAPVIELAGDGQGANGAAEDAAARAAAQAALAGRNGCAVVLDVEQARVVAIVNEDLAVRRALPAASTFKLVTALAALGEGLVDPDRKVRVGDAPVPVDLEEALARSSNDYFSRLGGRVGTERLYAYASALGLGRLTPVPLAGEDAGRVPFRGQDARSMGGFGEGVLVTPLQLAWLTGSIATGDASFRVQGAASAPTSVDRIPPDALRRVRAGMVACAERGTAARAFGPGSNVAGKTATASGGDPRVAMFTCYAPADHPRWVVVVALEEPGVYGADAAVVAAAIVRRLG